MGVVFRQSVEGNTAQCVSLLSHIEESLWLLSSDDRLKETQLNVSLLSHIEECLWVLSSDNRLKETQLNVSLCCHI